MQLVDGVLLRHRFLPCGSTSKYEREMLPGLLLSYDEASVPLLLMRCEYFAWCIENAMRVQRRDCSRIVCKDWLHASSKTRSTNPFGQRSRVALNGQP